MNKRMLLSAPVRLYWELAPVPAGGLPHDTALSAARDIAAMKVFFATLRLSGGVRDDLPVIASELTKAGVNLKLSVADLGSFPDKETVRLASGVELYLDSPGGDLREALDEMYAACREAGLTPASVSAVPSRDNSATFAGFFARCVELGFTSVSLPNPDLVSNPAGTDPYILDGLSRRRIREAAESVLSGGKGGGALKLFVHELFLYRELKPTGLVGDRLEYAGCQAAEALAYIGADGQVYPCSNWPEPIGSLEDASFREIWSGPKRKDVVRRIGELPGECRECPDGKTCLGGCRGMAVAVGRGVMPDPGCPVVSGD